MNLQDYKRVSVSELDSYKGAWNELRHRERLVIGLWLGYIPGVVSLGWLISFVTPSENTVIVIAALWMLAFARAGLRVSFFRCPQCNNRFYMNKYYSITLGRKCPHCGIKRFAEK
jgi:DNA-directed RNA polymerase subunit RPC12/RpoP